MSGQQRLHLHSKTRIPILKRLTCRNLGNRRNRPDKFNARCGKSPVASAAERAALQDLRRSRQDVCWHNICSYVGIVTTTRKNTWPVLLIATFLALMGGPLLAASPHELCDAMHHACKTLEAVTSCCCGDRSEVNPSQVPSGRIDVPDCAHALTVAAVAFQLPVVTSMFIPVGAPLLEPPPDLRILFSDLRI